MSGPGRGGRRGAAVASRGLAPARALRALERIRGAFGAEIEPVKLALLGRLLRGTLATAREVERYHEALCFLHAYPDSTRIDAQVRVNLAAFARRADLARHREALKSSGIEGTPIDYRFFYPTARWLAARWPRQLSIEWDEFENTDRLEALLGLLALPAETPGLDELTLTPREWIGRMKRRDESDASFLARRFAALPMEDAAREVLYDSLDVPLRLVPGPDTPSRTRARTELVFGAGGRSLRRAEPRGPRARPHYTTAPLDRSRPVLAAALRQPPRSVRPLSPRDGAELVNLARAAMVTRQRDLDAFAYADPRDARLVDMGDGLQFACLGVVPERRLMLESVYGFVTLKNGVPVGYVLVSALFGSSEIAYNVFETYRGAEAGHIYGRALAMTAHLFDSDTFTIYPYQLGDENEEGLKSGAWWFYWKLGFRPKDRDVLRLARRELARMRRNPRFRSSIATLRRLARRNVYFHAGRERDDVIGVLGLANTGLAVTRYLARRFGSDRERAAHACAAEAAELLGVRSFSGWSSGERAWWRRWAPLVLLLPGVARWSSGERRRLTAVIRAKGGVREDEFVRRFDAHRRLRAAIRRLARATPPA